MAQIALDIHDVDGDPLTICSHCLTYMTIRQPHRLIDRDIDKQTERQADRETDRQIIK